jgi:hypothetical protein
LVAFVEPSLALLVDKPPTGPQWVHAKFDGYRVEARIDGDDIRLLTRKAFGWTKRFPTIAEALRALDVGKALLDGEVVLEDKRGGSQGMIFHRWVCFHRQAQPTCRCNCASSTARRRMVRPSWSRIVERWRPAE